MSEKETTTTTTTPPEAKASSTLNVNAAAFTPGKAPSTPSPPPAARSQPKPHTTQNSQPRFKQQQRQQQGPGGMPMPMPMPMPGGMMMGPNGPMPMPMPMPGPGGMMMGPNGPMPMPMPPPGMMPGPGGFPPGMFMGPPPPGMPMPPPGMGFPFPPGMAMPPNFMFPPGGKMPPPMGSPPRPNSGTPSRAKSSPHHTSAPPPHVSHSSLASASSGQPEMPRVSVGNAALAAVRSKEPPKFSCVLLSGIPAVGKTTLGRDLVNSLKEDGMGWAFFSGADFLQDVPHKRSVWETTQEVFDALSKRLDELIEQQNEKRDIKGLVIDKNCKGIEDVYYLNALLKSKNIPFVGIVGMECDKDDILIERMGGEQYLREKLKYHRVIHARIVNLAKTVGMYRPVDATKSKEEVVRSLRTMVLGCAAQPPSRGIRTHHYDESRANIMVDSFSEYCGVMNRLFECVPSRNQQFPVTTEFLPFSVKEMTEKKRVESLKHRYGVRSKVDGQRYILIFHNEKLYLVPPHMRAVLSVPSKAWLGNKLTNVGAFVLEGVLARLSKDRQKEKFLVYDALFWSDSDNTDANTVMRMDWNDRQECLRSHLCPENDGAFFPADTDCIIVHHLTHKMEEAVELLDSEEFTTDGLIFQPINPVLRSDHLLVWQQPSNITVDFRIGSPLDEGEETAPSPTAAGRRGSTSLDPYQDLPVRSYRLEVYDKVEKEYVQYEDATVAVRHPEVVPGCIVSCNLKDEVKRGWLFKRIRYDLLRPDYKHEVDDLLNSCLVPRAKLVSWLMSEKLIPSEIQKESPQKPRRQQQQNNNNNSNNNNGNNVNHNRTTATPTYSSVVRGDGPPANPLNNNPVPADKPTGEMSDLKILASIVPSLQVVAAPPPQEEAQPQQQQQQCAQCRRRKTAEDLRQDKRDKKLYCYSCWSKLGYGFCPKCSEFKELQSKGKNKGPCASCAKKENAATGDGAAAEVKPKKSNKKKPAKATDEAGEKTEKTEAEVAAAQEKRKKKKKETTTTETKDGQPAAEESKEKKEKAPKKEKTPKKTEGNGEAKKEETSQPEAAPQKEASAPATAPAKQAPAPAETADAAAASDDPNKKSGMCAQQ